MRVSRLALRPFSHRRRHRRHLFRALPQRARTACLSGVVFVKDHRKKPRAFKRLGDKQRFTEQIGYGYAQRKNGYARQIFYDLRRPFGSLQKMGHNHFIISPCRHLASTIAPCRQKAARRFAMRAHGAWDRSSRCR